MKKFSQWGYYRCLACRAITRAKCAKCEHCGACTRGKNQKRK